MIQWKREVEHNGWKGCFRKYFDTVEEAHDYFFKPDRNKNQMYRIKDRESNIILLEGHSEFDENDWTTSRYF